MFLNSWGIFHFIIIYYSFNIFLNPAYILLINIPVSDFVSKTSSEICL